MALTVKQCSTGKAGRYGDGRGLCLVVKPTGARSWVLRVQVDGRRRDIGLGGYIEAHSPDGLEAIRDTPLLLRQVLTLAEARDKAAILRGIAKAGADPLQERDKDRRGAPPFAVAARQAHDEFARAWTPKNAAAFLASLERHAFPTLGAMRVDHIGPSQIRDALAPIWVESPVMAEKVRKRIGQTLSFAKARGWRSDPPPVAKEVKLGLARQSEGGNFAAMPYADVPGFLSGLEAAGDTMGRLALRFTILTAARSGEARKALWEQIDLDAGTWARPADMMKMRRDHTITLSKQALAILETVKPLSGGRGLVFPGNSGKAQSDMTLTKAMRTAGMGHFTVHGFRSSFRDWAAELMPTMPGAVADYALAHVVGSKTDRAYLRSDFTEQRRALLAAWGDYCTGHGRVTDFEAARAAKRLAG